MAQDKFALVSGGGRGIGRAAALALAAAGWHVAVAGRSAPPLAEVAREIERLGRRALAHACDIVDPASVDGLYAAVERAFGRLDLLFNEPASARRRSISRRWPTSSGRRWSTSTSTAPSFAPRAPMR